jgi:hypothetical protein
MTKKNEPYKVGDHVRISLNNQIMDARFVRGGHSNVPIVYGYVRYRDPFGSDLETRFGYFVKVTNGNAFGLKNTIGIPIPGRGDASPQAQIRKSFICDRRARSGGGDTQSRASPVNERPIFRKT